MDTRGNEAADFGIAYELDQEGRAPRGSGTAGYMAPEIKCQVAQQAGGLVRAWRDAYRAAYF